MVKNKKTRVNRGSHHSWLLLLDHVIHTSDHVLDTIHHRLAPW